MGTRTKGLGPSFSWANWPEIGFVLGVLVAELAGFWCQCGPVGVGPHWYHILGEGGMNEIPISGQLVHEKPGPNFLVLVPFDLQLVGYPNFGSQVLVASMAPNLIDL
jgi:hypothetical protein